MQPWEQTLKDQLLQLLGEQWADLRKLHKQVGSSISPVLWGDIVSQKIPQSAQSQKIVEESFKQVFPTGIGCGLAWCACPELVQNAITTLIQREALPAELPQAIDVIMGELSQCLKARAIKVEFSVPLLNFYADFASASIKTKQGTLKISKVAGPSLHASLHEPFRPPYQYALQGQLTSPIVFTVSEDFISRVQELRGELEDTLIGLRSFKSGTVGLGPITFTIQDFGPYVTPTWHLTYGNMFTPMGIPMHIDDNELPVLENHLTLLQVVKNPRFMLAVRRLADAEGRSNPVDAVLDCAIGLEAMLNPGGNRGDVNKCPTCGFSKSEISEQFRNRFSSRFPASERPAMIKKAREIYKWRSGIAHAGKPSLKAPTTKAEAATIIKVELRAMILHYLPMADAPQYSDGFYEPETPPNVKTCSDKKGNPPTAESAGNDTATTSTAPSGPPPVA